MRVALDLSSKYYASRDFIEDISDLFSVASGRFLVASRKHSSRKMRELAYVFYDICNCVLYFVVTPGRFELPTCGLGNRRSIHLSYGATNGCSRTFRSLPQQRNRAGWGACAVWPV